MAEAIGSEQNEPSSTSAPATLVAVIATAVTLPFGQAVTGVQLDRIGADLTGGLALLQWVPNAYNLAFAAFLLVSGALADRVGRRRTFVIGTSVFLIGSLASSLAPGLLVLDLSRLVAGAGASAQLASAPALLAAAFPEDGPARSRAFGLLGTGFGVGLALGPVVGGWLVSGPGWRWAFLIVLPFALSGLLAARWISESRAPAQGRFDIPGAVTFAIALVVLMLAVSRISAARSIDGLSSILLVCVLGLFAVWTMIERRSAHPMLDLKVLGDRSFLGAAVAWYAAAFGFVTLLIYAPFFLQSAKGATALQAGLALLPMTIPLLLVPSIAPRLVALIGAARLVPAGVVLIAMGDLVLAGSAVNGGSAMAPGLVLIGIGAGTINGLLDNIAMSTITPERAGMAAGGFQTMRVSGDAISIALAGALYAAAGGASGRPEDAIGTLLLVLAAITLFGAIASRVLLRDRILA